MGRTHREKRESLRACECVLEGKKEKKEDAMRHRKQGKTDAAHSHPPYSA